jgi:hypothetical protein
VNPKFKYFSNLCIFLLIPGIHLLFTGKKVFGILIFAIFVYMGITPFLASAWPYEVSFLTPLSPYALHNICIIPTAFFILLDRRNLDRYRFKRGYLISLAFVLAAAFAPVPETRISSVDFNTMHPVFKQGEKVVFDLLDHKNPDARQLSPGRMVLHKTGGRSMVSRVVGVPFQTICTDFNPENKIKNCRALRKLKSDEYFVHGDNSSSVGVDMLYLSQVVTLEYIKGVNLKKIKRWSRLLEFQNNIGHQTAAAILQHLKYVGLAIFAVAYVIFRVYLEIT